MRQIPKRRIPKRPAAAIAAALLLAGCGDALEPRGATRAPTGSSAAEGEVVAVEGAEFRVTPGDKPWAWAATPLDAGLFVEAAALREANLLAIERATGCAVDRGAVVHEGIRTRAAIIC